PRRQSQRRELRRFPGAPLRSRWRHRPPGSRRGARAAPGRGRRAAGRTWRASMGRRRRARRLAGRAPRTPPAHYRRRAWARVQFRLPCVRLTPLKIGLQIPSFTWQGGPDHLGADLATIVRTADQAGFDSVSVMDHFFQIRGFGPPEREMPEAYTTLAFIAA